MPKPIRKPKCVRLFLLRNQKKAALVQIIVCKTILAGFLSCLPLAPSMYMSLISGDRIYIEETNSIQIVRMCDALSALYICRVGDGALCIHAIHLRNEPHVCFRKLCDCVFEVNIGTVSISISAKYVIGISSFPFATCENSNTHIRHELVFPPCHSITYNHITNC